MKKGFTLIELLVAIAILAVVLAIAGVIFRVSIDSQQMAAANADIMQKLRTITDQLNADFKGLIIPPQGKVSFSEVSGVRADCIVFFANGDFQSTNSYSYKDGKVATVVGNVASVFYGQPAFPDPYSPDPKVRKEKILTRRQTILTADPNLVALFDLNPPREYCNTKSLSKLVEEQIIDPNNLDMKNLIIRPVLDPRSEPNMYMAKGVDNFTIEYAQWNGPKLEWNRAREDITTKAFKFTFTLYDSKGIIKNGRTFTHIVYLD